MLQLYGKPKWTKLHSKQSHYMHTQQPLCTDKLHAVYTQNPWHACTNPCMHRNGCAQRNSIQLIKNTWMPLGIETTHSVLWLRTGVETTHSVLWPRTGFIPRACVRDHVTLQMPRAHLVYRLRLGSLVPRRLGRILLCADILWPLTSCILVSNLTANPNQPMDIIKVRCLHITFLPGTVWVQVKRMSRAQSRSAAIAYASDGQVWDNIRVFWQLERNQQTDNQACPSLAYAIIALWLCTRLISFTHTQTSPVKNIISRHPSLIISHIIFIVEG